MKYCKYGRHYSDWVPYGSTNVSMPGFECTYEGKLDIPDCCDEDENCPAFEELPDKYDTDYRV